MSGYGYTYRSVSTYNTVREESRGPVIKPFVPFVPNANSKSEGYVTKKTLVPVASRPPYDDNDHDYKNHSFPSDEWHRQKSPIRGTPRKVDEFLTKVQNEASRPQRSNPVASTDWRQPPQPTSYNNYGDHGGNKEGRKPIGSTIRNDGYSGPNGYGDYNNKEGHKPTSSPIRNGKYDGYDGANNGYGNYNNKEGQKPTSNPIQNDKYYGYDGGNNGYGGYGNYDNKEGRRPFGSTTQNDKYDGYNGGNGYGDYDNNNNKEGRKPTSSLVRNDKYDGYDGANNGYSGGYGNYNNKEGHRPFGSNPKGDKYDGYNGGNGYDNYGNYNNKEGHKPTSSLIRNDNYDRLRPAENYSAMEPNRNIPSGLTKPKIGTAWTTPPRKGTQLSEPTNDIDKAIELLKEAAKVTPNDHGNKGGDKAATSALSYDNYDNYQRRYDGVDRSTPSNNWATALGNDSRLGKPRSKFDKGMELVKEPERLKNIVAGPPMTPNKDDYGGTIDRRDATSRYGNFNFSSRPHTPPTPTHVTFIDDREPDYRENVGRRDDTRSYVNAPVTGPIIDSRYAEKKYGGKRI